MLKFILSLFKKPTKRELLLQENLWYLNTSWDWSVEIDYIRSPRKFWKHCKYPEYLITAVYYKNPIPKQKSIELFIIDYDNGKLIQDIVSLQVIEDSYGKPLK